MSSPADSLMQTGIPRAGVQRTLARLAPDDVHGEAKFVHTITVAYDEYIAELIQEADPEQALIKAGFTAIAEALVAKSAHPAIVPCDREVADAH